MAAFSREPSADGARRLLFGRAVLALFAVTGGVMALAYAGVLPDLALAVGVPALVATQLIDVVLYNRFRLDTGPAIRALIVAFVYCQSVALAVLYRQFRKRVSGVNAWSFRNRGVILEFRTRSSQP